jgi:hypothetical protein
LFASIGYPHCSRRSAIRIVRVDRLSALFASIGDEGAVRRAGP